MKTIKVVEYVFEKQYSYKQKMMFNGDKDITTLTGYLVLDVSCKYVVFVNQYDSVKEGEFLLAPWIEIDLHLFETLSEEFLNRKRKNVVKLDNRALIKEIAKIIDLIESSKKEKNRAGLCWFSRSNTKHENENDFAEQMENRRIEKGLVPVKYGYWWYTEKKFFESRKKYLERWYKPRLDFLKEWVVELYNQKGGEE